MQRTVDPKEDKQTQTDKNEEEALKREVEYMKEKIQLQKRQNMTIEAAVKK